MSDSLVQNEMFLNFLLSFLYFWSDLVEIKILNRKLTLSLMICQKNENPSINKNSASGVLGGVKIYFFNFQFKLGQMVVRHKKNVFEKVSVKSSQK
jgi:hypothetical protein